MHWHSNSITTEECSNVIISAPNNWCHRHLNLQFYNGILAITSSMMRYTSETVNLISWASVLFPLVQLFALLIDLQLHYLQLAHKIMSF